MAKKIIFYNTYETVVSLLRDLPKRLADEGYDVVVVISRSDYRKKGVTIDEHFAGTNVRLKRVGIRWPGEVSTRLPKTFVMLSYCFAAFFQVMFSKADLRVFLTQPPFFANVGRLKKFFAKEEHVGILMDLYPEVIFANKLLKEQGILGKTLSRLEQGSRKSASKVVTIGRDMTGYLEQTGIAPEKIAYIPNWAGAEAPSMLAHQDNSLRKEWGYKESDFLVVYSGNLGASHYFTDLLESVLEFKDHEHIKFVFIGEGVRKKEVVEFQAKHNLPTVRIMGYQPMDRLVESLSAADVHFISLDDGFGGMVVPSKVFGVLSVGRPIIFQGGADTEIAKMLAEHDCGVQVNIGDQARVTDGIRKYADDGERTQRHSEQAWEAYANEYSSKVGINRYVDLIAGLLSD